MANPEPVLGPRKTMFILVIVVGCFAVLWPRILYPLFVGTVKQQIQPNQFDKQTGIKQERPLQLGAGTPHPAIRERGRAIVPEKHTAPPRAAPPLRVDGRPIPIPGVRPPMGGAGGVVPPPKSSMGFFMPVYTICIVVFFMYTLCKILFRKTSSEQASPYEEIKPDPLFRRRVFEDSRSSERSTPDTRLVVNAISGLVAEVRQQMEETYNQSNQTNNIQEPITNHNHANGNVHSPRHEQTPVRIIAQELPSAFKETAREPTPEPKESTPEPKGPTPEPKVPTPEPKEPSSEVKVVVPESKESAPGPEVKSNQLQSDEDKESLLKVQKAIETTAAIQDIKKESKAKPQEQESDEELSEEEIEYEDEEEVEETPAVKQFRGSVEREKASVKVLGMEMTAHCEGGSKWGDSPGVVPAPPPVKKLPPPPAEVSSIYLEGSLPHQSRLLVTDSETHREDLSTQGKDSPIVLSGKMTLSLINDESTKASPERDSGPRRRVI